MSHTPDLSDERLAALAAELGAGDQPAVDGNPREEVDGQPVTTAPEPASAPEPFVVRAKQATRRRVVVVGRRVVDGVSARVARDVFARSPRFGDELVTAVADRGASLALDLPVAELRAEVAMLRAELQAARQELVALSEVSQEVDALTVNGELAKAQVLALGDEFDRLGWAIAPGAGPDGAGARLAETRLRLNELDRRVRLLADASPAPPASAPDPASGARSGAPHDANAHQNGDVASFDYSGFEYRFRGDPGRVRDALFERYGELLADHQPVLDVGCGRGELIEALVGAGVDAKGVELDAAMADAARSRGVDVVLGDALEYLRTEVAPGSLGSIISIHVAEHLPLDSLLALFELARDRLRPGGALILETPNPASLVVLGNSYVMDPTHVRPLHPSLMTFLAEGAGFDDVRLRFYEPAIAYHLPRLSLDEQAPDWARQLDDGLGRLNEVLFGPQEYAIVARTPAD